MQIQGQGMGCIGMYWGGVGGGSWFSNNDVLWPSALLAEVPGRKQVGQMWKRPIVTSQDSSQGEEGII